jgi:hypothetical protein
MFGRKTHLVIGVVMLVCANLSLAALNNTNRDVGMIDVMKTHTVIWIGGARDGQPSSCNGYPAISCKNDEKFCELLITTALSAKLAGKKVEYNYSGQCDGPWAEVNRFRMMN